MAIGTNYSMGVNAQGSQPLDDSYLSAPMYAPTSGAATSISQGTGSSVPVNAPTGAAPAAGAAGAVPGQGTTPLPTQSPISDYSQVAPWLQTMQNQNKYGAATGWLGQGINPQVGANEVQDYNKLGSMYGYDAASSPYFQTDAFKNDPRFSRSVVTDPFQTFNWNYAGFGTPNNGNSGTGYSFYAPGQGFNPINGQWAQGGQVYAPPQAANGHDTYWSQGNLSNLGGQVNPYLPGASAQSLYGQRGSFAHDNYYPSLAAQQALAQQQLAGGIY